MGLQLYTVLMTWIMDRQTDGPTQSMEISVSLLAHSEINTKVREAQESRVVEWENCTSVRCNDRTWRDEFQRILLNCERRNGVQKCSEISFLEAHISCWSERLKYLTIDEHFVFCVQSWSFRWNSDAKTAYTHSAFLGCMSWFRQRRIHRRGPWPHRMTDPSPPTI